MIKKLTTPTKKINLEEIQEGQDEPTTSSDRRLLACFEALNVHFHFLAEPDLGKLHTKAKFQKLFDIGVLSLHSAGKMKSKEFGELFKDGAPVHVETADFVIAMKKDLRSEYRKKLIECAEINKWELMVPAPFAHHMMFKVCNKAVTGTTEVTEEDPFDLSGL